MGFHLKKVEAIVLNNPDDVRALARRLKGLGGTESERGEKAKRKANIKAKILAGEMTAFRWCVGHVLARGLRRRVNGQHSSEVFLELTDAEMAQVIFPIHVTWEDYDCDELIDLANLFEQFDPGWSTRNAEDLVGAHLGIHEELRAAVSRFVAMKVTAALKWYAKAVEHEDPKSKHPFNMVHDTSIHPFFLWCGSFLQKGKTDEMVKPTVLAAVYHTARDGDEEAKGFWRRVAGGKAPLDSDTVEYKLAEFLDMFNDQQAEWPRSAVRHFNRGSVRPSDLDAFATCLRAFGAWKKGTKVSDVYTPTKGKKADDVLTDLDRSYKAV